MDVIEKFLNEVSWKFDKGYPDITNEQDILLLDRLLEELNINELKNLSVLMGLSPNLDDMMLKAKIIQFASDNATKFLATLNDADKEHRVFLKQALDKQILNKVNGVWKHGYNNVGLTWEAVDARDLVKINQTLLF